MFSRLFFTDCPQATAWPIESGVPLRVAERWLRSPKLGKKSGSAHVCAPSWKETSSETAPRENPTSAPPFNMELGDGPG